MNICEILDNKFVDLKVNPNDIHSLNLAFLGDAIHSFYVRLALVVSADFKQKELQGISSQIVCAKNQAKVFDLIFSNLSEEEVGVAKRARNAKTNNIAKNSSIEEYKKSTAFEALIGYLFLTKQNERMEEFLMLASDCAGRESVKC